MVLPTRFPHRRRDGAEIGPRECYFRSVAPRNPLHLEGVPRCRIAADVKLDHLDIQQPKSPGGERLGDSLAALLPLLLFLFLVVRPGSHPIELQRKIPVHLPPIGVGEAIDVLCLPVSTLEGLQELVVLVPNDLLCLLVVGRPASARREAQALQRDFGLGRLIGLRSVFLRCGRCVARNRSVRPATSVRARGGLGSKRQRRRNRHQQQGGACHGQSPKPRRAAFHRSILHNHDNPPVKFRFPLETHAETHRRRGQRPGGSPNDQELGVILRLLALAARPRIGHVILAKPNLTAQPPHQRLIKKQHPRHAAHEHRAEITALDVRPFMGQRPTNRLLIPAQTLGQHDHRPIPSPTPQRPWEPHSHGNKRLLRQSACQHPHSGAAPARNLRQQASAARRRETSRPDDPHQRRHPHKPPRDPHRHPQQVQRHEPRSHVPSPLRSLNQRPRTARNRNRLGERRPRFRKRLWQFTISRVCLRKQRRERLLCRFFCR